MITRDRHMRRDTWDYLIVTAGGERQARACEEQLRLRRELGLLAGVVDVLVVPDPEGRRVGSGGSKLVTPSMISTTVTKSRAPSSWLWAAPMSRTGTCHIDGVFTTTMGASWSLSVSTWTLVIPGKGPMSLSTRKNSPSWGFASA